MTTAQVQIDHTTYSLHINCHHNDVLRTEFNRLTKETWGFDFEAFYQSGYWGEDCILYSLFDGDRIVSHTTVTLFEMRSDTDQKTIAQLGTVMTDSDYRNRGLSRFLMERIEVDFLNVAAGMFLFANNSVLDFYPKFGFLPLPEFQAIQSVNVQPTGLNWRKLDLSSPIDLELFEQFVPFSAVNKQFSLYNYGIEFFYCYAYPEFEYRDAIFYIEELQCVVVATIDGHTLTIYNVCASEIIPFDLVIHTLASEQVTDVVLGFTPGQAGFEMKHYKENDLTLYVTKNLVDSFTHCPLQVPLLAHT